MSKKLIALLLSLSVAFSFGFAACGSGNGDGDKVTDTQTPPDVTSDDGEEDIVDPPEYTAHEHEWKSVSEKQATCGEAGRIYYECECGATKTVRTDAATGIHSYDDKGVCSECGHIDFSQYTVAEAIDTFGYYVEDADSSGTYTTGDSVLFGSYPQDYVDDEEALSALAAETGTLPVSGDCGDWTSYGYYDGGEVSDYMFYKDVTVQGVKYRGVYLLGYRSYYSWLDAGADYSFIDDEGWETGQVYWFEYSPIKWTVLDYIDGALLLNSVAALDAQPLQAGLEYDASTRMGYVPDTETFANDWSASTMRYFLNNTFYNFAFSEAEQALIKPVTLDNANTGSSTDGKYQIIQQATTDKVFLLSYQDYLNTDYGFPEEVDYDSAITKDKQDPDSIPDAQLRRRTFTEYSTIQGLHRSTVAHLATGENACTYLMRSAGALSYSVCSVSKYGSLTVSGGLNPAGTDSYDTFACNGNLGMVPTLYLKVN